MKERGPALLAALIDHLAGPESPIGDREPLSDPALRDAEAVAGVALSPAVAALFQFDVGWVTRRLGWFVDGVFQARPAGELIAELVGPYGPAYEELCATRFPGKALLLGGASESWQVLLLDEPDAVGEGPVLHVDVDDTPVLAVADAGFDLWLARELGLLGPRAFADEVKATSKRLFGRTSALHLDDLPKRLPPAVRGPPPGTVTHVPVPIAVKKPRRLTDAQVTRGLAEHAEAGNVRRLGELLHEARERGLPRSALDEALVAAALKGPVEAVDRLLAAGADPNARKGTSCALARAPWNPDPRVPRALLAAGADPNGPSILGRTALFEAVESGREDLVADYVAAGATGKPDTYQMSPLHHALVGGVDLPTPPPAIIDRLVPVCDLDVGPSLAVLAVECASEEHLTRLLAAGVDPDRTSPNHRRTALHAAFDRLRDDLAPRLVAAGADRAALDDREIALDDVYGPQGEDVRPLDVRYAPAAEPQTLEVAVQAAVLLPTQAANLSWALRADTWQELAAAGLFGGGTVRVTDSPGPGRFDAPGFTRFTLGFEVAGLDPRFVAWMAAVILGDAPPGRSVPGRVPALRVTGVRVTGSAPGGNSVDADAARAWVREPWRAWDGAPAAPVEVDRRPGVRIRYPAPPTADQTAAFDARCRSWWATHPTWRPEPPGRPHAWDLVWSASAVQGTVAFVSLIDHANRRPGPWPYDVAGSAAVLRALTADLDGEVTLVLPG